MGKITLARALSLKKRVIGKISDINKRIIFGNSIIVGNKRTYNIDDLLKRRSSLVDGLIELKLAIQAGNKPIAGDIFRLSEKKSELSMLQSLNTKSGSENINSYHTDIKTIEYDATIDEKQKDHMVAMIEADIDEIQQKLDHHNHTTGINVPEFDLT